MNETEFAVILETDGKTWSAYVPDLLGCVAAASSRLEVEALIKEAIVFHLEGIHESGETLPSERSFAIQVRISA